MLFYKILDNCWKSHASRLGECRIPNYIMHNVGKVETGMNTEKETIKEKLVELSQEHHDLDAAIHALIETGSGDTLLVQRLKKKKLALKDEIAVLEDQLFPDIIA